MQLLARGLVRQALRRSGMGAATRPRAEVVVHRYGIADRVVALTFDDGPSEWTEAIADVLHAQGGRGTFFVIGEAIDGREELLRTHHADGHEIGNHTMRHPRLDLARRWRCLRELAATSDLIRRVTGARPRLFRPPGFHYAPHVLEVAHECGLDYAVLASAATDDFNRSVAAEIVEPLLAGARPGAIIGLHDGRPPREPPPTAGGTRLGREPVVEAVRQLVPQLLADGYRLVTVSELLALPDADAAR